MWRTRWRWTNKKNPENRPGNARPSITQPFPLSHHDESTDTAAPQQKIRQHPGSHPGNLPLPEHLIYPVFVHEGTGNQPISSLPGCTRWSDKGLVEEAKRLMDLGIRTLDLFPAIPDGKKTPDACEACNPDGLIPRTIYALKSEVPRHHRHDGRGAGPLQFRRSRRPGGIPLRRHDGNPQ